MTGTHLTGLPGTNPLAFFAALGVQVLFEDQDDQPRLWWTEDVIPHAVVDASFDVHRIVDRALEVFPDLLSSPALSPGFGYKADDDAKFMVDDRRNDLRTYLLQNMTGSRLPDRFASCLVAEGSYDANRKAKPSDLYFSAGKVAFLRDARKILDGVREHHLTMALHGPWEYDSRLPSLRWDTRDDPNWALAATKPGVNKRTCPGPEAFAILGFTLFPVFGETGRTLTQNCEGEWNRDGSFVWPLWNRPTSLRVTRSLLSHVTASNSGMDTRHHTDLDYRRRWLRAWGIHSIMQSPIRRSKAANGLGNMGPARAIY